MNLHEEKHNQLKFQFFGIKSLIIFWRGPSIFETDHFPTFKQMAQGPALHAQQGWLCGKGAMRQPRWRLGKLSTPWRKGWDFCWGIQQRIRGIKRHFFLGGGNFVQEMLGLNDSKKKSEKSTSGAHFLVQNPLVDGV